MRWGEGMWEKQAWVSGWSQFGLRYKVRYLLKSSRECPVGSCISVRSRWDHLISQQKRRGTNSPAGKGQERKTGPHPVRGEMEYVVWEGAPREEGGAPERGVWKAKYRQCFTRGAWSVVGCGWEVEGNEDTELGSGGGHWWLWQEQFRWTVGSEGCIAVRWWRLLSRACAQRCRLGCGWCCCWFASCCYAIMTNRTHRSRFCASIISVSPGSLRCSAARCWKSKCRADVLIPLYILF